MAESCRESLIDAANRLFHEQGFHAVGLDRILDEVGVTKTTFYNHFESKEDLIIAVLDQRDQRELAEWLSIMRARGGGDPRAQILALFDLLEEWLGAADFNGCMFIKAAAEFPDPKDPVHVAAAKHGEHLAAEVHKLASAAGAADPGALTSQLMIVLGGAIVAQADARSAAAGRTARQAAALLVAHHLGSVEAA